MFPFFYVLPSAPQDKNFTEKNNKFSVNLSYCWHMIIRKEILGKLFHVHVTLHLTKFSVKLLVSPAQ